MRHLLPALLLLHIAAFSQKVKFNEYDKFIKQRRLEFDDVTILSSKTAAVSFTYKSIGVTFYVLLSGYGWGEATVDAENEVIFLLDNDSTVTVKSTGIQTSTVGTLHNSYKHQYFISPAGIDMLSQHEVKGIRKYSMNDFVDMEVSKEAAVKIKKLSSLFIQELEKARVFFTLKNINVKDVANHIGDSVRFCSKVFSTRYFESSEGKPTILDLNEDFNNQSLATVIWEEDRKNFDNIPETLYNNKEVCISGVVKMVNNKPQIAIHSRKQIIVTSPLKLEEVPKFIGDSVTVRGTVLSGNYFQNGVTNIIVLNIGTGNPSDQTLTVIVNDTDNKNTVEHPENPYVHKEISVTGRIGVFQNKPQMVLNNKDQIKVIGVDYTAYTNTGTSAKVALNSTKAFKKETEGAETPAEFPGGLQAFKSFLSENLQAPSELHIGESKTTYVQFLIDTTGKAQDFQILQSAGGSFDKEAIRVLKKMPNWKPASKGGRPLARLVTQPITFFGVVE